MPQLNRRLYFACYAMGVADFQNSPTTYTAVRGLQSLGINTTFNLAEYFEIGQLAVYQQVEDVPDVEMTCEKVLDGSCPVYILATQGAAAATLVGRSNQRANVAVSYFPDTNSTASGNQLSQCVLSGMYPSQISYEVTTGDAAKEQVTLVGNNKVWSTGSFVFAGFTTTHGVTSYSPTAPEGVNRRQHLNMTGCLFPTDVRGISSSGTNDNIPASGMFTTNIQSFKISTNLGRDQLLELGRRGPFFRYINFPVQVSTSIEILAHDGDFQNATETGADQYGNNVVNQAIRMMLTEGLVVDLGNKNKMNQITYGGGGAGRGGGNATITYSYQGFNVMTVQHPQDPTVGLRP